MPSTTRHDGPHDDCEEVHLHEHDVLPAPDPVYFRTVLVVEVLTERENNTITEIGSASAIGKPDVPKGGVVEVRYLYVGANGRLVQPTVLRERTDKAAADCTIDQLRHVNKAVLDF